MGRWTGRGKHLPETRPPMWQGPMEQEKTVLGTLVDNGVEGQHRMIRSKHGVSIRMTSRNQI